MIVRKTYKNTAPTSERGGALRIVAEMLIIMVMWVMCGCTEEFSSSNRDSAILKPLVYINNEVVIASDVISTTMISPLPSVDSLWIEVKDKDGQYSKRWESVSNYPEELQLLADTYIIESGYGNISEEGFDTPSFYGSAIVTLGNNEIKEVDVDCLLINAVVEVMIDKTLQEYEECYLTFHSAGGGYYDYKREDIGRLLYLNPDDVDVYLTVKDSCHDAVTVKVTTIDDMQARHYYYLTVTGTDDGGVTKVTVSMDEKITSDDIVYELDKTFWDQTSPEVLCDGFESGAILTHDEGNPLTMPVRAIITDNKLSSLKLTLRSAYWGLLGVAGDYNLTDCSQAETETIANLGIELTTDNGQVTVDFSNMLEKLCYYNDSNLYEVELVATDKDGLTSNVVTLKTLIEEMPVEIVSISTSTIGVNRGRLEVRTPGENVARNLGIKLRNNNDVYTDANNLTCERSTGNDYIVEFDVPIGTAPINGVMTYCGKGRDTFEISRIAPKYSFEVDAFVHFARLKVEAEDASLVSALMSLLQVYSGEVRLSTVTRDVENGILMVGGLDENTRYTLRLTISDNPGENDFSEPKTFTTEKVRQLPNASFEDRKIGGLSYKMMPSGGRYSQTIVPIVNMLNYTTYENDLPQKWATTNEKTFNKTSNNQNTWYMAPSVYTVDDAQSGAYAVRIDNVAWDPDGDSIADYIQKGLPYLSYNPTIPTIKYRAVGKIFLGSYSIDMATLTEHYDEGIAFGSRPIALNGYYKYLPTVAQPDDCGMVRVEVIGVDGDKIVTIASGDCRLNPATGYTAFTIPLDYSNSFGIKAVELKVMISASQKIGDILEESQWTAVQPDLEQSQMKGASLWVDELLLTY